jgi:hypothetical protein
MSHKLLSDPQPQEAGLDRPLYTPIKRRSFFMYAGATAGATALVLAGCKKDDFNNMPSASGTINVGSGDVGVLNYAYALEQLEAGFYTTLRTGKYYTSLGAGTAEKQILDDLYYHEVIHRDFFKAALTATPGATVIPALTPNFSTINFDDRMSVLSTAKAFEDLGVAAYNGAGRFIKTAAYLVIAGKIVSVEARHAAIIRDLLQEASFVGNDILTISEGSSLERSKLPSAVVGTANSFLADGSKLDVSGLG